MINEKLSMKTDEEVTELAKLSPLPSQLPEPKSTGNINFLPDEIAAVTVYDLAPVDVFNVINLKKMANE